MITELFARGWSALSGTSNPDDWLINWVSGGEPTSSGERVNEENALKVPAIKAAVSVLSEAIRMLPLEVYRVNKSGTHEPAPDHPVQSLLDFQANEETDSNTWKETEQNHAGLWGNGYSYIQRTLRGDPVALLQRSPKPERTAPFRNMGDVYRNLPADGRIYYRIRDNRGQTEPPVPAADMLHVKGLTIDGLVGKSYVQLLRETIGGAKAAQRFANERFANDGAQSGYIRHPGKLSEPAFKRLKASQEEYASHGNRHKKQILEEGMEFQASGDDPEKMQMIEVRHFNVEEIACFYRISPHLLQDLMHGTFSNITELGRQFIIYTLAPWCSRWTSEINVKLLKPPYRCRFNYDQFLQGDHAARSAYHRTMFGIGCESINEIRHKEGLNPLPDPNADEHFIPLNMAPLSKATDPEWMKGANGGADKEPKPGGVHPGDGETPAEPLAEPKQEAADSSAEVLAAAEAVLKTASQRMESREAINAKRFANDASTYGAKLDAFYADYAEIRRSAILGPMEIVHAAGGVCMSEQEAIDDHIKWHKELLLQASECSASELPARVAAVVENWGKA